MNAISPEQIVYEPARRKNIGVLIMLCGPSGSGKTLTALMLARGLAGPNGKIAVCDTEHDRALYFAADDGVEDVAQHHFAFFHHPLKEPFLPSKFEAAAVAAQQQKAAVFICDSFSHEHVGPGGLLDYHEVELQRMAGNDYAKRERMKAAAWIKPKGEHKHMLQRLWQMNGNIILCCHAEKKIALVEIKEGPKKGKTDWVDQGFQPVCGGDIPYAMNMSFLFDVKAPGVPIVIKPLMASLKPIIDLTKPMDIATGARIAAWARGDKASENVTRETPGAKSGFTSSPSSEASKINKAGQPDGTEGNPSTSPPDGDPQETVSQGGTEGNPGASEEADREAKEQRIITGAEKIEARFRATTSAKEHFALVDDADVRKQMEFVRRNRKELYERTIGPAVKDSYARSGVKPQRQSNPKQPGLGIGDQA